jgi:hypothetical protein
MTAIVRAFSTGVLCLCLTEAFGEVPILNPEQTVNPGTGEMAFSLPLLKVEGVNGLDYDASLQYKAGIQYYQEASPAGLGFSYGPGGITRKVVFVADDNAAGDHYQDIEMDDCSEPQWHDLVRGLVFVVAIVLTAVITIATEGAGLAGAAAVFVNIWTALFTTIVSLSLGYIVSSVMVGPGDYSSGTFTMPGYNQDKGRGAGFFKGGHLHDLPDIYFVNTPYLQGEFSWAGSREEGGFVFKTSSGNASCGQAPLRVLYDIADRGANGEEYLLSYFSMVQGWYSVTSRQAVTWHRLAIPWRRTATLARTQLIKGRSLLQKPGILRACLALHIALGPTKPPGGR